MRLAARGRPSRVVQPVMGRVTHVPVGDVMARRDYIIFARRDSLSRFRGDWQGYGGLVSPEDLDDGTPAVLPAIQGVSQLMYLEPGDVVLLLPSGTVNVLYRKSSSHNTILLTERCNSLCLMCSQPPKRRDDSYRVPEILRLAELINVDCEVIGMTGGEPTLLGEDLLRIIRKFKQCLPRTSVHMLTNGRLFADRSFAQALAEIGHPHLTLGIPLYSDVDSEHDYVVQARGAYDETVEGLYNLARYSVRIELRVVIHSLTYRRLPQLAEFIYRNFPFVVHVAVMGLEPFGYANWNWNRLWIDPVEYQSELECAVLGLDMRGLNVSVYNHQLCTLPKVLWPFACRSISDWKNIYLDVCDECEVRDICGGFFHSARKRHSAHIRPLRNVDLGRTEWLGALAGG